MNACTYKILTTENTRISAKKQFSVILNREMLWQPKTTTRHLFLQSQLTSDSLSQAKVLDKGR